MRALTNEAAGALTEPGTGGSLGGRRATNRTTGTAITISRTDTDACRRLDSDNAGQRLARVSAAAALISLNSIGCGTRRIQAGQSPQVEAGILRSPPHSGAGRGRRANDLWADPYVQVVRGQSSGPALRREVLLRFDDQTVLTEVIDNKLKSAGRQFELSERLAVQFGIEGTQSIDWRFAARPSS